MLFRPQSGNSQPPKMKKVTVRNRLPTTVVNTKTYPVAPPGSRTIKHLLSSCTACHLCINSCPTGVLQPSLGEYGPHGFLKPHLNALVSFCNFDCTRCGEVCPTGAITLLPAKKKKRTQMGRTQFIKKNCVVETDKKDCGACAEHCPTKAVRMVPFEGKLKIPELDNKYCIGCGACEHICPVRPHRAIFVDGLPVQGISEPPISKPVKIIPLEDFPF
jgi:formate hydrogenlyase subunit 6/NADH:ubiquinone oxidoreductase subunit I